MKSIIDKGDIKQKIQTHWDNNVCDFDKEEDFNEIDNRVFKTYPFLPEELRTTGQKNKGNNLLR